MADASRFTHPSDANPPGWGDVFAALPLQAPPASRWPGLAAHIDMQRGIRTHRARKLVRLALAAALFAMAALPAAWMLRHAPVGTAHAPPSAAATRLSPTALPIALPTKDAATRDAIAPQTDRASQAVGKIDSRLTGNSPSITRAASGTHTPRHPPRERRILAAQSASAATNSNDSAQSLESLYVASAQLESLLAVARDVRVESAPAASLAGAFDAELATIDAQLAQPGLSNSEQRMLWQARVETLQRSAGFESHLRLLAAEGERLDGALVSID